MSPIKLPESGQLRLSRLYPGSKYRELTSVLTLKPPTESGRVGADALRGRALLEYCAEVLQDVIPEPVRVG